VGDFVETGRGLSLRHERKSIMKRLLSITAVAVFALGSLTACGGNDYCDQAKSANEKAADLSPEDTLKEFEKLKDAAPDELKDDFDAISAVAAGDPSALDAEATQKFQDAVTNITAYTAKECDVDLNA
jgi:hypothetical protein